MTLGALIVVHNEEQFIEGCIKLIAPYCNEIVVINHESFDNSVIRALREPKVRVYDYQYTEPVDMGAVRTFGLTKMTSDWIWQVDADEYYPKESCELIRNSIQNTEAISFRVPYYNLAWRSGYVQDNFSHYPDRLYRRDVIDCWKGILPNDMTFVKPEFIKCPNKPTGMVGVLEYDNMEDKSFENPVQPIIQAPFYHLARTRGRNFEYLKWFKYNKNIHPNKSDEDIATMTRSNQWVSGLYDIKPIEIPDYIPQQNIVKPRVSIVITNYNYAQYLPDSVESCLNQTHKPYEVIVVDDGSTDNSVAILNKYPIKVCKEKNNGVATARNIGGSISTGDYLIFLDADDKLDPTFIEETLKEMKGDIQIVSTDLEFFGDQQGVHQYPDFSSEKLKEWQIIPSCCALLDRHLLDLSGGFDPFAHYEDYEFWLKADKLGFKFKHIAKPLMKYRKHGYSRINLLDEKQEFGFQQLRDKYNIKR